MPSIVAKIKPRALAIYTKIKTRTSPVASFIKRHKRILISAIILLAVLVAVYYIVFVKYWPAPSIYTPYVIASDIASVDNLFGIGENENIPWNSVTGGHDFYPSGNLKIFRAAHTGVVKNIELSQDGVSLKWQVDVLVEFNPSYSTEYSFGPFPNKADSEIQLDYITVSIGQSVSHMESIGQLYGADSEARVRLTLLKDGVAIDPDPYFSFDAKNSILYIMRENSP
jgi:hypothetical protein